MKKLIYLSIISGALLFNSCSKNGASLCRVSEIILDDDPTPILTFEYDNQGRLIEFSESGGSTIEVTYNGLTGTTGGYTLSFDSKGRLKSRAEIYSGGGVSYKDYFEYKYNDEGYLVREIFTSTKTAPFPQEEIGYFKDTLVYSDGNLISKTRKRKNNSIINTYSYSYNDMLNKSWKFRNPFDSYVSNYLYELLGKQNKNLMSSYTYENLESDITITYEFEFILNPQGYVSEYNVFTTRSSGTNSTNNYKLNYTCD